MDCKCTTFDKYKLSRAPRSRAFLQFVGTRLGCGGAGARGHNQSITVIDTEVMRVQITCYVTMGAPPANSLWNEGLLTARYWCWVDTCTPSHHYYPVSVIVLSCQAAAGGIRGQMMSWSHCSPLRQLGHRGGWTLRTSGYWLNLLCGILITYYLLLYFVRWYYKAYNQICTIHTDCIVLHWLCQNMFLFSFQLKIVCLRPFQIFMSSPLCEFCLSEADIVMLSY